MAGGQYLLVAHNSPSLIATDIYGYTALQVTNLVLIENHQASDNFQVVNRQNGKPISGASVVFANEPTRHHQKNSTKSSLRIAMEPLALFLSTITIQMSKRMSDIKMIALNSVTFT